MPVSDGNTSRGSSEPASTGLPAVELCVEDVAGARLAERSALARIELCSALAEGGLTPSAGTLTGVLGEVTRVGVQVLIRPRAGHFRFDRDEVAVMERDIAAVRALGSHPDVTVGFVVGALGDDGGLDRETLRRLLESCGPAPTTLHRCVDLTADLEHSVATAIELGFTRVLTSGGAATAAEGSAMLARLVRLSGDHVTILAAGGVRPGNVRSLLERSGVREIHLAARDVRAEGPRHPTAVSLIGEPTAVDTAPRPDAARVRQLLSELSLTSPVAP